MGDRLALLVGSYEYAQEPNLQRLQAPPNDIQELASVLTDPAVGGYSARILTNETFARVIEEVEGFLVDRQREDMALLYFSGHGIKDADGELYFAMANTRLNRLRATAVKARDLHDLLRKSRAGQQILILDCCYSGAFAKGMTIRSGSSAGTNDFFDGRGHAVITASDAIQYAFEEDGVEGMAPQSIFTRVLAEGLTSGDADGNYDGVITVDELYDYVRTQTRRRNANQTPRKWALDQEGSLVIAKVPLERQRPATLSPELLDSISDNRHWHRRAAVDELARLLHGDHAGRVLAAEQQLRRMLEDDSRSVAQAAREALRHHDPAHNHATVNAGNSSAIQSPSRSEGAVARWPDEIAKSLISVGSEVTRPELNFSPKAPDSPPSTEGMSAAHGGGQRHPFRSPGPGASATLSPWLGRAGLSAMGVAIAVLSLAVVGAAIWVIFGSIPVLVAGQGLLMRGANLLEVRADAAGYVVDMKVRPGAEVKAASLIAVIHPDKAQIREKLRLKKQEAEKVRNTQAAAAAADGEILARNESLAVSKRQELRLVQDRRRNLVELVAQGLKPANVLLDADRQVLGIQTELNSLENENAAIRARNEQRQGEIDPIVADVKRLEGQVERVTFAVTNATDGRVVEVIKGGGERVAEGEVLVRLEPLQQQEAGVAFCGGQLHAVVYVQAKDAGSVRQGQVVRISPTTVARDEFGYMLGTVAWVAAHPAVPKDMQERLSNERLVQTYTSRAQVYEVRACLERDATITGYRWSSGLGPPGRIDSGTLANASFVVGARSPLRHMFGVD